MPRAHGNQSDVIHAYFHGETHPHTASNLFHEGVCLYSYGRHFWLAYRHRDKSGKITFLLNGDYASVTTRCHQSMTQRSAPSGSLTISAGALEAAQIDLSTMVIKDSTGEMSRVFQHGISENGKSFEKFIEAVKQSAKHFEESAPAGATIFYKKRKFYRPPGLCPEEYNVDLSLPDYYHRPASALLFRPRKRIQKWIPTPSNDNRWAGHYEDTHRPAAYFICGMDDNQYFISELPGRPQTVEQAFNALKPAEVKQAETDGRQVERQGDWFFIHQVGKGKEAKNIYKQMRQGFDLTDQSNGEGASHIATRGALANEIIFKEAHAFNGKALLVSGQIRHSSREPPMLKLSYAENPEIWQACINTAKNSWSMGGNVD